MSAGSKLAIKKRLQRPRNGASTVFNYTSKQSSLMLNASLFIKIIMLRSMNVSLVSATPQQ
jgi:hypothetical protein